MVITNEGITTAGGDLAESISLPDAAKAIGVSERTLQRCVQRSIGTSPIRIVQDLRVERAAHLLRTTDLSLLPALTQA